MKTVYLTGQSREARSDVVETSELSFSRILRMSARVYPANLTPLDFTTETKWSTVDMLAVILDSLL